MADNYCQFSAALKIRKSQQKRAGAIIARIVKKFENDENYGYFPAEASVNAIDSLVWMHSGDESGDPDAVEVLARALVEELKINEPFILSWAYTCSKPRLNEFGGGAFCILRGKKTYWTHAWGMVALWAQRHMKTRPLKPLRMPAGWLEKKRKEGKTDA